MPKNAQKIANFFLIFCYIGVWPNTVYQVIFNQGSANSEANFVIFFYANTNSELLRPYRKGRWAGGQAIVDQTTRFSFLFYTSIRLLVINMKIAFKLRPINNQNCLGYHFHDYPFGGS